MDITWYGQACFKIKGKTAVLVLDPFDPAFTGLKLLKLGQTDTVLVTHDHGDHNYVQAITESSPVIISGPGEYEVKSVTITGVSSFHDSKNGQERGKNTIYHITIDGVSIVHLGDLGHVLTKEQVAQIGGCDILLVPVGGVYTIDAAEAAENITLLEASIVIPMHYKIDGLKFELDPLDKFLKEVGKEEIKPQPKLTITKDKLPQETEVIVLEKQ